MAPRDWTDSAAYAHMRAFEAADFAAEYVIRNDEFIAECRILRAEATMPDTLVGSRDFADRWGLRFRD